MCIFINQQSNNHNKKKWDSTNKLIWIKTQLSIEWKWFGYYSEKKATKIKTDILIRNRVCQSVKGSEISLKVLFFFYRFLIIFGSLLLRKSIGDIWRTRAEIKDSCENIWIGMNVDCVCMPSFTAQRNTNSRVVWILSDFIGDNQCDANNIYWKIIDDQPNENDLETAAKTNTIFVLFR